MIKVSDTQHDSIKGTLKEGGQEMIALRCFLLVAWIYLLYIMHEKKYSQLA